MAMRAAAVAVAEATPSRVRRFFCSSIPSFIPPTIRSNTSAWETAKPNCTLFIHGLNERTTTQKLREAFSAFGEVVLAKVTIDRVSGISKGFGFVEYNTIEEAAKGIEGMDGKFLDGWVIFVEYALPKYRPN